MAITTFIGLGQRFNKSKNSIMPITSLVVDFFGRGFKTVSFTERRNDNLGDLEGFCLGSSVSDCFGLGLGLGLGLEFGVGVSQKDLFYDELGLGLELWFF